MIKLDAHKAVHFCDGLTRRDFLHAGALGIGGLGLKEPVQMVIYGDAGVPEDVVVAVSLVGMACAFALAALWPLALGRRPDAVARA